MVFCLLFDCWDLDVMFESKRSEQEDYAELIPKLRGPRSLLKLWHCDSRNLLYIDLAMLDILLLSMVVGRIKRRGLHSNIEC